MTTYTKVSVVRGDGSQKVQVGTFCFTQLSDGLINFPSKCPMSVWIDNNISVSN